MKYAVIDIGSNTVRLAVYLTDRDNFSPVFSQKYTIGLAGYVTDGFLQPEGIRKACDTLLQCRSLIALFDGIAETYVFATASLRNVQNTQEAVDQIFMVTGFSVDVLSGQAEAYLDYYGVLHEAPLENGLLFDIGGGSTEIVTFAHDGPGLIESLPIGSLNLAQAYVEKIFPKQKKKNPCWEKFIRHSANGSYIGSLLFPISAESAEQREHCWHWFRHSRIFRNHNVSLHWRRSAHWRRLSGNGIQMPEICFYRTVRIGCSPFIQDFSFWTHCWISPSVNLSMSASMVSEKAISAGN